jgi:hypothetical protein
MFSCYSKKSIELVLCADNMARRLSKALRGKRRWFGLAVEENLTTRNKVGSILKEITTELDSIKDLRLMDFHHAGSEKLADMIELDSTLKSKFTPHGLAIVEVPLECSQKFKELLCDADAISSYGLESLTMSGKIRLVRERLNLPKPIRKR